MARRRRRGSEIPSPPDAVFLRPLTPTALLRDYTPRSALAEVEDRRSYHPLSPHRPARLLDGNDVQPNVNKKPTGKFSRSLPFGLNFADPKRTVICVRRSERKEVLHALKKTGKGKGRRNPRRGRFSDIGC